MNATKKIPQSALRFEAPVALTQDDKVRRFEGMAYSGKPITGHPYWGQVIFDLASTQAQDRLPMLVGHDRAAIAGFSETVEITDAIHIKGRLSAKTADGQKVAELADEGFPWQMSVHINPGRVEEIQAGSSVMVNGHIFEGPGHIFRDSRLSEVSFTPTGHDPNTTATVFSIPFETKDEEMPPSTDNTTPPGNTPPTAQETPADFELKFSQEKARADQLESHVKTLQDQVSAMQQTRRKEQVQKLFSDLGRDFTDDAAKPYLGMPDTLFESVAKDMRAMKPTPPQELFSEQATSGADSEQDAVKAMSELPY